MTKPEGVVRWWGYLTIHPASPSTVQRRHFLLSLTSSVSPTDFDLIDLSSFPLVVVVVDVVLSVSMATSPGAFVSVAM